MCKGDLMSRWIIFIAFIVRLVLAAAASTATAVAILLPERDRNRNNGQSACEKGNEKDRAKKGKKKASIHHRMICWPVHLESK
jgi:hypothetical protein